MKRLPTLTLIAAVVLVSLCAVSGQGQWVDTTLTRIGKVKLLTSSRSDLNKIFSDYEASDVEDHYQHFQNEGVKVEVWYSSGRCIEPEGFLDRPDVWNVPEWTAVTIRVVFDENVTLKQLHLDTSKFLKEADEEHNAGALFSKEKGVGIIVYGDRARSIVYLPASSGRSKLCEGSADLRKFYSDKGKFKDSGFEYIYNDGNQFASVTDLKLDRAEISGTSSKVISVETEAVDPENDLLTYNYKVDAGVIRGTGPKVVWDLTGVPPGIYRITAGVDDGCGICGYTKTRTIKVN